MAPAESRKTIKALHEIDVEPFLESLGLADALKKGRLRCSICKSVIHQNNIGFIYPSDTAVAVCCNNTECLFRVAQERRETE